MYKKGQTVYGWTILQPKCSKGSQYAFCECICGTKKPVLRYKIKAGDSTSCGCQKKKNLNKIYIGKIFECWLVKAIKNSKALAFCLGCDSTEKWVAVGSLVSGKSKSCGCQAVSHRIKKNKKINAGLIGKTFNNWRVEDFSESSINSYKCLCTSCFKNTRIIRKDQLLKGTRKSCGCQKAILTRKTMKEKYGFEYISQTLHHKKKMIKNGIWILYSQEELSKFKLYHKRVWNLTEQIIRKYPDKFNQRSQEYHVDHIFSIAHGFRESIQPEIIASDCNLRVIEAEKNLKKNLRSDISKEELLQKYSELRARGLL